MGVIQELFLILLNLLTTKYALIRLTWTPLDLTSSAKAWDHVERKALDPE